MRAAADGSVVILQAGAEGGDATLIGRTNEEGAWTFARVTDDQTEALFGETGVELTAPPALKPEDWVESWDEALRLMDRYRWARLHPLAVHPAFVERVRAAVEERLAKESRDQWTEHARGKWERLLRQPRIVGSPISRQACAGEAMDYQALKERHRAERDAYHPNLSLRVHRALSWLNRAEQPVDDPDGRFIFLWIAFNAAYATEIDERFRLSEQETFRNFLQKLVELDKPGRIAELVWTEFPKSIRVLLDNKFVFQDFWNFQNGSLPEEEWKRRFAAARKAAKTALAGHDTVTVLAVVLSRIYTLRNQLIHGGATWNGSVNREQMRDCGNLMGKLVPLVIEIMMDNPGTLWGDACYPVVK